MGKRKFGVEVCDRCWGEDFELPSPFFVIAGTISTIFSLIMIAYLVL